MKNPKILVKNIEKINDRMYKALIVLSPKPLFIKGIHSGCSCKWLENLLNDLLIEPKNILKNIEIELFEWITVLAIELTKSGKLDITRNFKITFRGETKMITENHNLSNNETMIINKYMDDYKNQIDLNYNFLNVDYVIFEYIIILLD